ncbi:PAS domain-containing protein [bacterium]|nr:PAS domain-containing protein [bacterium]
MPDSTPNAFARSSGTASPEPGKGGDAASKKTIQERDRTILLLQDEQRNLESMRGKLEAEGFSVATCSPEQALEGLRARPHAIVLVPGTILAAQPEAATLAQAAPPVVPPPTPPGSGSYRMIPRAEARGLPLLDRLRRGAPEAAVVIVGGPFERLPHAFQRGAVDVIVRPDDVDEIRAVLVQARARRQVDKERLDALEDARRTRKFFEEVLRGLGEGIVVIDEQAKIRYRNPEAARVLGEDDDATPDRHDEDGSSLHLKQLVLAPLLQLLVETLTEREPKTKMVALEEEDQKIFLDVTTSVLRSGDGRATGAVAVVRDRSAEKMLEEQLAHTERLATLGSLLAAIAHEIANPLSVITGCAEIGQETAKEAALAGARAQEPDAKTALEKFSKDVKDILEQICDAGLRCQTIANNLLQYSRRTPARVVEQDLNELVRKTLAFVGKYLGTDKVEVALDLDSVLPPVRVDAAQLQQALTNLIDNAVHAMLGQRRATGRGSTSTAMKLKAPRLSISTRTAAGQAVIVIADNGPGIPARQLERIWRPFYTTKERGTGLGLYITRRAVEHQGGTIALETEVGEGTTFTIRLPL